MLVCLLGSSGDGFKQLMVWLNREGSSIDISAEPLWQQLTSLSLCLHIGIWFWWGPCWQKLWVCHFTGVLLQGLPVRHQLVLSWEVMGQIPQGGVTDDGFLDPLKNSIIGAIPEEVCVLLEQLTQGVVKVDKPGMKGLRYVMRPKNSWSLVMFVGAGKACTVLTFPGSGWTPLAS